MGLICAWGLPGMYGHVNYYTDARGHTAQYFYRYGVHGFFAAYVYTRNGYVTAIDKFGR